VTPFSRLCLRPPQRYLYYVTRGVSICMLAPQPPQQIGNIVALLPPVAEDGGEDTQGLRDALVEEVKAEYHVSLKKSIGTEQHSRTSRRADAL